VAGGTASSDWATQCRAFLFAKEPVGWILAAGPVALWPTATDSALGSGKWGAGPTTCAATKNGWTYGALANIWSYGGWGHRVNASFLQPFDSFTTKKAFGLIPSPRTIGTTASGPCRSTLTSANW
jgi:hypothetical protein